jgi:hypothetical protein
MPRHKKLNSQLENRFSVPNEVNASKTSATDVVTVSYPLRSSFCSAFIRGLSITVARFAIVILLSKRPRDFNKSQKSCELQLEKKNSKNLYLPRMVKD